MTFKNRKRKKEFVGKAMDYLENPYVKEPAYPYKKKIAELHQEREQ